MPHVYFLISSFKDFYNSNFHLQVFFPMIPVKRSHSGLLTHRPLYPMSVASAHFSTSGIILQDSNRMLVYFSITLLKLIHTLPNDNCSQFLEPQPIYSTLFHWSFSASFLTPQILSIPLAEDLLHHGYWINHWLIKASLFTIICFRG